MPYLLLALGGALFVFALMRLAGTARTADLKRGLQIAFVIAAGLLLLYLAVTGRLAMALVGLAALLPILYQAYKKRLSSPGPEDDVIDLKAEDVTYEDENEDERRDDEAP